MLGSNELVVRLFSQVFDVVDEKWVGQGLLDQKDDLSSA